MVIANLCITIPHFDVFQCCTPSIEPIRCVPVELGSSKFSKFPVSNLIWSVKFSLMSDSASQTTLSTPTSKFKMAAPLTTVRAV